MPFRHKFTMYNIQTADLLFAMYRPHENCQPSFHKNEIRMFTLARNVAERLWDPRKLNLHYLFCEKLTFAYYRR